MEIPKSIISLSLLLCLTTMSASETEEMEVTTEGFEFPTYETTTNVTESPDDNGMAIPQELTPNSAPSAPQSKEEEQQEQQQPGVVTFPDNHKNFTPSQYLEDKDFPPYHNHLNTYQQQYKNYNEQKQMYSRKPIKFEENVLNNYHLPHNPDGGGGKKTGSVRVNRNPFPYAFENERGGWHGGEGHYSVQVQSVQENENAPDEWYGQQNRLQGHQQPYKVTEKTPEDWYRQQSAFPEHQQSHKQPGNAPEEWYGQQNFLPGHQQLYKQPEKAPEEWYKYTGLLSAYEKLNNEYILRKHKDTGLSYHVYPHEDKFLHKEIPHFDHHHLKKDEKGSAWKKVFHVLSALVPLGLLLASLSPNVISINSTSTTKMTRQRSEDAPSASRFKEEDVLKLMKKYGVESLNEAQCEDRILCELAVEGGKSSAGPIEKGFWFLANQTPWDIAEKAGMNDLFKAIKARKCETYKCHAKVKSTGDSSLGKKLVWEHKMTKQASTS